jgi:hypothetical protein
MLPSPVCRIEHRSGSRDALIALLCSLAPSSSGPRLAREQRGQSGRAPLLGYSPPE